MTQFFIADMHFGSAGNAKRRGFSSTTAMTEAIIAAWRARVSDHDTVWVLGDVGDPDVLRELPGTKHLVFGNDDRPKGLFKEPGLFESHADVHILDTDRGSILLVHRPQDADRDHAIVLHGHTHAAPPQADPRFVCVSIDQTNWGPVNLDEVMRRFEHRASVGV